MSFETASLRIRKQIRPLTSPLHGGSEDDDVWWGYGGPVKTRREQEHGYTESGLSNVIVDGIEIGECQWCAETYTGIPATEGLHRAIATAVICKKGRLASEQIKFLQKFVGRSVDLSS